MARGLHIAAPSVSVATYNGAGTSYLVQANSGVIYFVYIDTASDVRYVRSYDGGDTWTDGSTVFAGTALSLSTYYGRWSGVADDFIYLAYVESGGHDILFRSIDTANDGALSSQTTIFNGTSAAFPNAGSITIWLSRNGELRVAGSIDAGAEDGAWSSTDGGATWGDTIADPSEGATQDQYLGLPGWNADPADEMIIFWDASANEISVKRYDDDANTWTETSISLSMADLTSGNGWSNFSAAVDAANSRNILIAWSNADAVNADLRCWIIDDTTITEVTNVVLNSADDQGFCGISINSDNGVWYAFYNGKSDGSETFLSSTNIYYKISTDNGTTWGSETALTTAVRPVTALWVPMKFIGPPILALQNGISPTNIIMVSAETGSGSVVISPVIH